MEKLLLMVEDAIQDREDDLSKLNYIKQLLDEGKELGKIEMEFLQTINN